MDDWLNQASRLEWREGRVAERVARFNLKQIARELSMLKTRLSSVSSPVVFCHNDLLSANILLDTKGRVLFIDYEYGEYNYRAFDIANHFCEYAGTPLSPPSSWLCVRSQWWLDRLSERWSWSDWDG